METITISETTLENVQIHGLCGYKNPKKEGFPEKLDWLKGQFSEGLKIKTIISETEGTQGMIEYIPGQYCWRPVEATGYMFIHCIFVGFKAAYKAKGYGTLLLKECEKDSLKQNMKGVVVVTRKGSFMAGKELFVKNGFEVIDFAKPDFELLIKRFSSATNCPKFKNIGVNLKRYEQGLTIIRASQCPYTVKNVNEISDTALSDFGMTANIINLKSYQDAQECPSPFGTFCIIYNGTVVAHHPISKGRFVNIMNKILQ